MINRQIALLGSWLIALIAFAVTLYSSIYLLMPVCHLCWYQRICIYPLVIILGIGAYINDRKAAVYSLPLITIGMILSLYQYILQWFPQLESIGVCGLGPKCSDVHMKYWGFITYPLLSFIACLFIFIGLLIALCNKSKN